MAIAYNNNFDGTNPFSDTQWQVHCATGVQQTILIPGGQQNKYQAQFSYTQDSNVFVCANATPVIPASGTVGSQAYNAFRPKKRYVKGGDVIHFITPDTSAYIGVALMQLPG